MTRSVSQDPLELLTINASDVDQRHLRRALEAMPFFPHVLHAEQATRIALGTLDYGDIGVALLYVSDGTRTTLSAAEQFCLARLPTVVVVPDDAPTAAFERVVIRAGALDILERGGGDGITLPRALRRARERHLARDRRTLAQRREQYEEGERDRADLICRFLPDTTLIFVNRGYADYFGQPIDALVGQPFISLVPEADRAGVHAHIASLTPTVPTLTYEHPVSVDGEQRWQQWTDHGLFDASGTLIELESVGRDITRLKRSEQQALTSQRRYEILFERTPVMMHLVDRDGFIVAVNRQWLQRLGYRRHEVIGHRSFNFLTENSRRASKARLPALERDRKLDEARCEFLTKDGERVDVLMYVTAEQDETGKRAGTLAVSIDVTARLRAEREAAGRAEQRFAVARIGSRAMAGEAYRDLLDTAIDEVVRTLGVPSCAVFSRTVGEDGGISLVAGHGWPAPSTCLASAHEDDTSQALHTLVPSRSASVSDRRFENRFARLCAERHADGSSVTCAIVGSDGERSHMLCARANESDRFGEDELHFMEAIAKVLGDTLDREHADAMLAAEKERLRITLESIGDAVITTDLDRRIDYLNPVAEKLTGYSLERARGLPIEAVFVIVDERTREPMLDPVTRALEKERTVILGDHAMLIGRSGQQFAVQDSASPIRDRDGRIVGAVLVFSDVTESRRLTRQMRHQAAHDELTGLPNRREFETRLECLLADTSPGPAEHSLCYLDLDQFKVVNDTCGHAAGDELLRRIANLFDAEIRPGDTLARLGGDEFAILMTRCPSEEAERIAERIRRTVDSFRFDRDGRTFRVGVSIGLVPIDLLRDSVASVLKAADSACYLAKDGGRNRVHVHRMDDAEGTRRHGEMQWVNRLADAMENDCLQLFAQTIAPVQPSVGRAAPGAHLELLIRLVDDRGERIMPDAFVPAAERYHLAGRLDRLVIEKAFHWLAEHRSELHHLDTLGINLSGQSFGDGAFLPHVEALIKEFAIPSDKICFEITETAAIASLTDAMRLMAKLGGLGCRFALDDFGSGLSSYGYLRNLPVDYLKIDGQFVKTATMDPIDLAMVRSINEIGHLMGMQTVAEHVENDAVLECMRGVGVDWVQGYAIDRPQPIDATWKSLLASSEPVLAARPASA